MYNAMRKLITKELKSAPNVLFKSKDIVRREIRLFSTSKREIHSILKGKTMKQFFNKYNKRFFSEASKEEASNELSTKLSYEEIPVSSFKFMTILGVGGCILAFAGFLFYDKKLKKINSSKLFKESLAYLKQDETILSTLGNPLIAYGKESGGVREGRRNYIPDFSFEDDDKVSHLRYRNDYFK